MPHSKTLAVLHEVCADKNESFRNAPLWAMGTSRMQRHWLAFEYLRKSFGSKVQIEVIKGFEQLCVAVGTGAIVGTCIAPGPATAALAAKGAIGGGLNITVGAAFNNILKKYRRQKKLRGFKKDGPSSPQYYEVWTGYSRNRSELLPPKDHDFFSFIQRIKDTFYFKPPKSGSLNLKEIPYPNIPHLLSDRGECAKALDIIWNGSACWPLLDYLFFSHVFYKETFSFIKIGPLTRTRFSFVERCLPQAKLKQTVLHNGFSAIRSYFLWKDFYLHNFFSTILPEIEAYSPHVAMEDELGQLLTKFGEDCRRKIKLLFPPNARPPSAAPTLPPLAEKSDDEEEFLKFKDYVTRSAKREFQNTQLTPILAEQATELLMKCMFPDRSSPTSHAPQVTETTAPFILGTLAGARITQQKSFEEQIQTKGSEKILREQQLQELKLKRTKDIVNASLEVEIEFKTREVLETRRALKKLIKDINAFKATVVTLEVAQRLAPRFSTDFIKNLKRKIEIQGSAVGILINFGTLTATCYAAGFVKENAKTTNSSFSQDSSAPDSFAIATDTGSIASSLNTIEAFLQSIFSHGVARLVKKKTSMKIVGGLQKAEQFIGLARVCCGSAELINHMMTGDSLFPDVSTEALQALFSLPIGSSFVNIILGALINFHQSCMYSRVDVDVLEKVNQIVGQDDTGQFVFLKGRPLSECSEEELNLLFTELGRVVRHMFMAANSPFSSLKTKYAELLTCCEHFEEELLKIPVTNEIMKVFTPPSSIFGPSAAYPVVVKRKIEAEIGMEKLKRHVDRFLGAYVSTINSIYRLKLIIYYSDVMTFLGEELKTVFVSQVVRPFHDFFHEQNIFTEDPHCRTEILNLFRMCQMEIDT